MRSDTYSIQNQQPAWASVLRIVFLVLALFHVASFPFLKTEFEDLMTNRGTVQGFNLSWTVNGVYVQEIWRDSVTKQGVQKGDVLLNPQDLFGPVGSMVVLKFQTGQEAPRSVPLRRELRYPFVEVLHDRLGFSWEAVVGLVWFPELLAVLVRAVVAWVIFFRYSRNWMALLCAVGLLSLKSFLGNYYILVKSTEMFYPFYLFFNFLTDLAGFLFLLLFPTGRFQPRWSWMIVLLYAAGFWQMNTGGSILLGWAGYAVGGAILVYRYGMAFSPAQRQQAKWILLSAAWAPVLFLLPILILFAMMNASYWILDPGAGGLPIWLVRLTNDYFFVFFYFMFPVVNLMFPVGVLLAIQKYRLWDVDFLINRSLVYGGMTLMLLGLFALTVIGVSLVAEDFVGGAVIAASITGMISGIAFQPARRAVQRLVDSRLYGIKIDYHLHRSISTPVGVTQVIQRTHFGAYKNLELVGRGGMAEIYRTIHPDLNVPVAVKLMAPALSEDASFRHRFLREAEVVSRLIHPNLIRIFKYGEFEGQHYIVMEFLNGRDLGKILAGYSRMGLAEALPILCQVSAGLDYAHQQGVIHRDIKPSNILIEDCAPGSQAVQRVVLTDFGIAKIVGGRTTLTGGAVIGTLDYIAPEQIQALPDLGPQADVYSLGIMTFRMLTGELPFHHQNPGAMLIAHMTQPPPDPRDWVPDLPETAASAVLRALHKDPSRRFASAGAFVQALSGEAVDW
jgi:tRNA A-37 threonylcarbamoyl transferase component Bud32